METLAVKYRPRRFVDIVEQDVVKTILVNQLKNNETKNGYLFVGPAGCGKTTAARIFANDINEGLGSPIEIDGASNNGVENIRSIIDQSKFKAIDAKFKIFIIDECHMLSIGAWNAFLKLLEEPPAGTIFILCTTDPQKIPNTILSRVQRYDFKKISTAGIQGQLELILQKEFKRKDLLTVEALNYIAKQAAGGMRDAISLMEKCISFVDIKSVKQIDLEMVITCLGTVDYEIMWKLLLILLFKDSAELFTVTDDLFNAGKDLKLFMKAMLNFQLDIIRYGYEKTLDNTQLPPSALWSKRLKDLYNSDEQIGRDLVIILDKLIDINNNIKFDSYPKATIEAELFILGRSLVG